MEIQENALITDSEQANKTVADRTGWKNAPSLTELKQDMVDAQSDHTAQVTKIRAWLDLLHARGSAAPPKRKGRSSVQPKLIRKHAEWRYSALTEAFMSTKDVFNVKPRTFEDKDSAIQNSLVLNYQLNNDMNKVAFVDEFVRTLVDEGTCIAKIGWESKTKAVIESIPIYEYYENGSEEHQELLQEVGMLYEQNPLEYNDLPEELKAAFEESRSQGIPLEAVAVGSEDYESEEFVYNRPTVEICNFEDVIIDPSCEGVFDKAKFVIHTFTSCKGDLDEDDRYFNLDRIDLNSNTILGTPDNAVDQNSRTFNFKDKPRQKFFVHEYWGEWDINGDGKLVSVVVSWVGDTIIRMQENPFPDQRIPFVVVPYLPVKKNVYGEPDAELLEDNQRISGAVTRGMIDLLGRSANSQRGMRKDALDAVNKRKYERGDDYEFNPGIAPDQAFHMDRYPEIPTSAQYMLNIQNAEAEAVSGVKAFSGGISGDALGKVATGVRGVLDAASKREIAILRRLAKGFVDIGKKFLMMNQEFLEDEKIIRLTNERYVAIRREGLAGLYDLELSISTAEEDDAKASELAFMLQTTGNSMDFGITKLILCDIARLRKMPDLARKIEDYSPEPDPIGERMRELEMERLEAEIAKLQSETHRNYADGMQKQSKADNLAVDTDKKAEEFVSKATGKDHQQNLERIGEQARSQAELKLLDHELKGNEAVRKELIDDYIRRIKSRQNGTNPNEPE